MNALCVQERFDDDGTMDAPFDVPHWMASDAQSRTYLWSLHLQATPFFYDPNPSFTGMREAEPYSAPSSPAHPTFQELIDELELVMEKSAALNPEIVVLPNTPHAGAFDPVSPLSSSTASSSSSNAFQRFPQYLPASPRSSVPPLPRRSTVSYGANGDSPFPNAHLAPPRAISKSRSVPNFSGITKHPRSFSGNARRKYSANADEIAKIPPVPRLAPLFGASRAPSPTPSIVLTSPASPRGSTSSMSLLSSMNDDSETSYSYSSSSSDMDSVMSRESRLIRPPELFGFSSVHEARLRELVKSHHEEPLVPDTLIPYDIVNDVFDLRPELEALTIDTSEFLPHPFSCLKQGSHGLIVPCAWTLIDLLSLHRELKIGDTHLFLSNGHSSGRRYLGLYRILFDETAVPLAREGWASVPMKIRHAVARNLSADKRGRVSEKHIVEKLRNLNSGAERLYPVLLQFVHYDWDLFDAMAERIDGEAIESAKERHAAQRRHSPGTMGKKYNGERRPRVVTVDGVAFEMITY